MNDGNLKYDDSAYSQVRVLMLTEHMVYWEWHIERVRAPNCKIHALIGATQRHQLAGFIA